MRIVFLSNYFNHHQSETSRAWNDLTKGQYCFVETGKMRQERAKLGYSIEKPEYVLPCFQEEERKVVLEQVDLADVVLIGSAPEELIGERQRRGKLVIRYSERIYKDGYQWYKWPFRLYSFHKKYGRHKNTYLLCSSGYTAADYAKHGAFRNKAYQWGYFPETRHYELEQLMAGKQRTKLLWCGRFLDWKHPEYALQVAKRLKEEGYDFQLEFVGNGEKEEAMKQLARDWQLTDRVNFLGAVKADAVRSYMEAAGIFLFTSDFHEGWGAVLNEAMNSGCAVVASHAIGATPFLVKHEENGLIFKSGDWEDLYRKVKRLLEDSERQRSLGEAAYHTITKLWNAEVAAQRLMVLAQELKEHGRCDRYEDGPCSPAKVIRNNWFKG